MSGPWEDYAPRASASASALPWEEYAAAPQENEASFLGGVAQGAGNIAAGAVRGAGSIGATLIAPYDIAKDAIAGKGLTLESNRERRAAMDGGLREMGAETDSWAYQGGKLAGEIAGTAGVGGGAANLLGRIPGVASAAPGLLQAIGSGGMTANGATGAAGLATRVAGGAVNGALTAGLVNPEDAAGGAAWGGSFPVLAKGFASAGTALGRPAATGMPNATKLATAREGLGAGYILPPSTLRPTFANRTLEAFSGKDATKQLVSMKNSDVTESLVRKAVGIADDVPLTKATMESLRKTAGTAYADVSALSPQAAADLEALKVARNKSQGWFKAYNVSQNPEHLDIAKDFRSRAGILEDALEGHAKVADRPELIPALRNARKEIAKTYTVERALNDAAGTVNAKTIGRMYEKGMPLTAELKTVGKFASAFPTANQTPMQIGSPGVSKLGAMFSTALGGGGFAAAGPAGLAASAIPFVVPPLARARLFSEGAQKGLLAEPGSGVMRGLLADDLQPLLYRSNGLLAGY